MATLCVWIFWSCLIMDSEASLNDPGNLLINLGTSCWEGPDFSLRSSDNKLLLPATKPGIVDKLAPVDIFGASSKFFPAFAHAARWTSGPEWEDALLWSWSWGSMLGSSTTWDGLGGSMGKPEATSSGLGLNFSLRLLEFDWLCRFCNWKAHVMKFQCENRTRWRKVSHTEKS